MQTEKIVTRQGYVYLPQRIDLTSRVTVKTSSGPKDLPADPVFFVLTQVRATRSTRTHSQHRQAARMCCTTRSQSLPSGYATRADQLSASDPSAAGEQSTQPKIIDPKNIGKFLVLAICPRVRASLSREPKGAVLGIQCFDPPRLFSGSTHDNQLTAALHTRRQSSNAGVWFPLRRPSNDTPRIFSGRNGGDVQKSPDLGSLVR
jgi:hypothetical protein